jgi:hypothetical protein
MYGMRRAALEALRALEPEIVDANAPVVVADPPVERHTDPGAAPLHRINLPPRVPAADPRARRIAEIALATGFGDAAPLFTGPAWRDAVDAAAAVLGRERSLHLRVIFQAGIGALLVVCFATAGSPVTRAMAAVAALLSFPTWMLALGAPSGVAAAVFAAPVVGTAARQVVHSRLLTIVALFLGAGAAPQLAIELAERHVGAILPGEVVARALSPTGTFSGKVALRPEAEAALLRAAARLERVSQIRVRMTLLAVTAITLAAVFAPAFRQAASMRAGSPVPTHADEEERPATLGK